MSRLGLAGFSRANYPVFLDKEFTDPNPYTPFAVTVTRDCDSSSQTVPIATFGSLLFGGVYAQVTSVVNYDKIWVEQYIQPTVFTDVVLEVSDLRDERDIVHEGMTFGSFVHATIPSTTKHNKQWVTQTENNTSW